MDNEFLEQRIKHAVDQMRHKQFLIDSHFARIQELEREINGWGDVLLTLNAKRQLRQIEVEAQTDAEAARLVRQVWPDG